MHRRTRLLDIAVGFVIQVFFSCFQKSFSPQLQSPLDRPTPPHKTGHIIQFGHPIGPGMESVQPAREGAGGNWPVLLRVRAGVLSSRSGACPRDPDPLEVDMNGSRYRADHIPPRRLYRHLGAAALAIGALMATALPAAGTRSSGRGQRRDGRWTGDTPLSRGKTGSSCLPTSPGRIVHPRTVRLRGGLPSMARLRPTGDPPTEPAASNRASNLFGSRTAPSGRSISNRDRSESPRRCVAFEDDIDGIDCSAPTVPAPNNSRGRDDLPECQRERPESQRHRTSIDGKIVDWPASDTATRSVISSVRSATMIRCSLRPSG